MEGFPYAIKIEHLLIALDDMDSDVRKNAAWALGEIMDARALEPLIAAMVDEDHHVREKATWAVRKIKNGLRSGSI